MAATVVTTKAQNGVVSQAKISVKVDEFGFHVQRVVIGNLRLACQVVADQTKRNISISSRSAGPSKPGEFPHANTGRLRNSIFWSVDEITAIGIVGTTLFYGVALEFGTTGGKVIVPIRAKALSWISPTGKRVFAKRVVTKPMAPRSFLRRTMIEMRPTIARILTQKVPDVNLFASVG